MELRMGDDLELLILSWHYRSKTPSQVYFCNFGDIHIPGAYVSISLSFSFSLLFGFCSS